MSEQVQRPTGNGVSRDGLAAIAIAVISVIVAIVVINLL